MLKKNPLRSRLWTGRPEEVRGAVLIKDCGIRLVGMETETDVIILQRQ